MHLFKKHISRRTVLKGVGATIALPLIVFAAPSRQVRGILTIVFLIIAVLVPIVVILRIVDVRAELAR